MKLLIPSIKSQIGTNHPVTSLSGFASGLEKKLTKFFSSSIQHSRYNAFISFPAATLFLEEKLEEGLLQGRTVCLKDNIAIKGWPLTCASNILTDFVSPYHATVVERILKEGGVIVGKTNHDEFAMGSSNEFSVFGPVKNPVDLSRVPGGSSGGSAVAVALGMTDLALGSDTGGSVRQPAAFCGVYGMKPTYGRVSRYGLVAFASSFDQIGPIAGSTKEVALLLQVIAGHDPKDSTSADTLVPTYIERLEGDLPERIGIPWDFLGEGVNKEILETVRLLASFLEKHGCKVSTVTLPHLKYAIATYYVLTMAEASSNLARYDGVGYGLSKRLETLESMYRDTRSDGFGEEVKRRIMLGTYVLSSGYYDAYYRKAQKVRRLIYDDFASAFQEFDIILFPTTPTPPFKLGEHLDNPLEMYLSDIFTTPSSLVGLPTLSIPVGSNSSGLPIGMQLIGDFFAEETILRLSHYIEKNCSF